MSEGRRDTNKTHFNYGYYHIFKTSNGCLDTFKRSVCTIR